MKLTLKWSNAEGQGYVDAKEVAALMRNPDIATLDFLKDCAVGIHEIYQAAFAQMVANAQLNATSAETERNELTSVH